MGSIYVICSRQCPNGDGIYTLLYALYKYSTSITNQPTNQVLTFLLAAFQPTTPVFPSTLALNMEDAYTVLCNIRARNKVFRRACSQVILLNHQIEAAKARYDRARAVKRLSFRYSNRLKLTSLEGVRNLVYEFACVKCEEIEGLQAKLRELTGGVYDFEESDESDSDDQLSDC